MKKKYIEPQTQTQSFETRLLWAQTGGSPTDVNMPNPASRRRRTKVF